MSVWQHGSDLTWQDLFEQPTGWVDEDDWQPEDEEDEE